MDGGAHAEAAAGRPRAERATRWTWCACARGGGGQRARHTHGRGKRARSATERDRGAPVARLVPMEGGSRTWPPRQTSVQAAGPCYAYHAARCGPWVPAANLCGGDAGAGAQRQAHGHPRSNFAKGIPRFAPSVSRTRQPTAHCKTVALAPSPSDRSTIHPNAHRVRPLRPPSRLRPGSVHPTRSRI